MFDDARIQGDSVADHYTHSETAVFSVERSTDSQLSTMFYVRLTLQSDLINETPASIFAAHKEQGTIFYLPELTALPALDEYAAGERYLQYHILIQSPLQEGVKPTCPVFDSLGCSEVSKLGFIESKHCKDMTGVFSQYFLSAVGRGHAELPEIVEGLQEVFQPVLIEHLLLDAGTDSVAPVSLSDCSNASENHTTIKGSDLDVVDPISELESALHAPRGTAAELDLPDVESNGSSASYIARVCNYLVPPLDDNDIDEIGDQPVPSGVALDELSTRVPSALLFDDVLASKKVSYFSQQRTSLQKEKLDTLISRVSELSGMQSKLYNYALTQEDDLLRSMADEFERLYCVLRDSALELRMVSLEPLLLSVKEWLEDAVRSMGKQIEFTVQDADVQVDAVVAEAVADAISSYLVASVTSVLFEEESISISLVVEYSGTDVLLFITHPVCGVSLEDNAHTSDALLQLQAKMFALHGAMAIERAEQEDVCITVSFPVTQAMIEGLVIQCGDEQYLVPMNQITECVDCNPRMGVEAKENKVILGGEAVPCVRLREYVELEGKAEHEQCIVIQSLSGRFGLIVDGVVGELQAAVKPVGFLYEHIEMISGVSIKADGVPCLVLNLQHLQGVADCLIIN